MAPLDEDSKQTSEELQEAPKVNGDLGSWLYVLGGIPAMILFFVVLFGLVGSCDSANVMLHG